MGLRGAHKFNNGTAELPAPGAAAGDPAAPAGPGYLQPVEPKFEQAAEPGEKAVRAGGQHAHDPLPACLRHWRHHQPLSSPRALIMKHALVFKR